MLYLLAFFLPPLALLLVWKPIQAIISLVLFICALLGLFLFVIPGILIWLISVGHAILVINAKRADQRTEKIVSAMKNKNAKT
jgi:uncharacterized membrane protein YvlD (DUF360 family)